MKKLQHNRNHRLARGPEYPPVGDQLDVLWKGLRAVVRGEPLPSEVTSMIKQIDAVKQRFPKPRGR